MYFNMFIKKNNKFFYLHSYLMFKKKNLLFKKKFNYLKTLHPLFFKNFFKKRIRPINLLKKNNYLIKQYYFLKILNNNVKYSKFNESLNGKKKFLKTIFKNRKLLNFLNFLNYRNSNKLSNYILNQNKCQLNNRILNIEYSLMHVCLNTNLVKNRQDLIFLLKNNQIFLNRSRILNKYTILNINDILEFTLKYKYFNYVFLFKKLFNKHILKIKNKLWFKLRLKNKNKLEFQDKNFINKIYKYNLIQKINIPQYLEVDYSLLTLIILYKNFDLNLVNINIKKILSIYLFRLYNWK